MATESEVFVCPGCEKETDPYVNMCEHCGNLHLGRLKRVLVSGDQPEQEQSEAHSGYGQTNSGSEPTDDTRVCPRCGSPAAEQDICQVCGLALAGESEVPTRSEWEARQSLAVGPPSHSPDSGADPKVIGPDGIAVTGQTHQLVDPFDPPRELDGAARIAIVGLALAGLVFLIRLFPALTFHSAISEVGRFGAEHDPESAHGTYSGWVIAGGLATVLAAGAFIPWFFFAYSNLKKIGVSDLRFSNGWAAGGWFVPIVSLFRPKQVANDLWRGSEEGALVGSSKWHDTPLYPALNWWWGTWIAGALLTGTGASLALNGYASALRHSLENSYSTTGGSSAFNNALDLVKAGTLVDVVGCVSLVAASVLGIMFVWQATQRFERIRRELVGTAAVPITPTQAAPIPAAATSAVGDSGAVHEDPTIRPTMNCPDCAETVLAAARVCRFCGHRFDA